ncbi:MAG: hypothetical protein AAGL98_05010 [Planctomycetota bacterium]
MNPSATPPRVRPRDNPFRSACVDALDFVPIDADGGWSAIGRRLHKLGFRGAVIGPHGHGKTTVLQRLADHVTLPGTARGGRVSPRWIQVRPGDPGRVAELRHAVAEHDTLLMVDGYDLLGPVDRWAVRRRRRPVLVTSHGRTLLPTLLQCRTSPELLGRLIDRLSPTIHGRLDPPQIAALHRRHRGNLRDAFRELYDRVADGEFAEKSLTTASSV